MSEALPGQMSLFEGKVATSQLPDGIIRKMKKDLEVTYCRGLFAIDDAKKALEEKPNDKFTFGAQPVEFPNGYLDTLCRATQSVGEALEGLRKLCPDE